MKVVKKVLVLIFINLCSLVVLTNGSTEDERKPHIIYMGELPKERTYPLHEYHNTILSEAIGNEVVARQSKIYSYGKSFNGFVARLLPHEAELLKQKQGVVSVFPNTKQKLLTTRSWDFIGMTENVKRNPQIESNMIVAIFDTGIWTGSPSFKDTGFGPPPANWKGKCEKGVNFTACNNKVIGAQYFNLGKIGPDDSETPLDLDGHGTHTASTAAGVAVPGASLYGIAEGTARGGVPSARIASYKVCWGIGCDDMDLLAAFDAAIADGVDVISISLGGNPRDLFEDPIAIGAFHALKKGILTTCAGGNSGPSIATIQNVAPWVVTVAATAMDRTILTDVELGNGEMISGMSINTFQPKMTMYPFTSGALASNGDSYGNASACNTGTLNETDVKGKIVYCLGFGGQDSTIGSLGGVGTVMSTEYLSDTEFITLLPATLVNITDGQKIEEYINSTKSAKAYIYRSRSANMTAPFVASFSSRGPQHLNKDILKPDLAAPGLSVLAAYTPYASVTGYSRDKRIVQYNILSGTSMACPHAAGAAAYVKSFHPKWSPAAIKSALMTTAKTMRIKPAGAALAYGAGQINPRKAVHPGLIYDIDAKSYVTFLCKEGYNNSVIALITGSKNYNCSNFPPARGNDGLNYPSMHVQLENLYSNISAVFYRTVTYVGQGETVYKARIKTRKGLSITVTPNILRFNKPYQKKSFKVILNGNFILEKSWYIYASVVWTNCKHYVKSPILVYRSQA